MALVDREIVATLDDYADGRRPHRALPLVAYADVDLFGLEVEVIFGHSWLLVAPLQQIPPYGYVSLEIAGEPIVVIRRGDDVTALSNLCRHRGLPILDVGTGTADRLTCPYHLWSYRLDGTLIGAPLMAGAEGFDPSQCRLPPVRTEIWQGMVFVNLDADAAPLGPRLTGIDQALRNYQIDRAVTLAACDEIWDINWKLGVENSSESYHHMGPHADSVGPLAPSKGTYVEAGTQDWAVHRTPLSDAGRNPELDDLLPLTEDDRSALRCYTIFPSTVLLVSGAIVNWLSYLPLTPGTTRLRAGLAFPMQPGTQHDLEGLRSVVQEGFDLVNGEDKHITTRLQRATGARLLERGHLSPKEGVLPQFYAYLARQLSGRTAPR